MSAYRQNARLVTEKKSLAPFGRALYALLVILPLPLSLLLFECPIKRSDAVFAFFSYVGITAFVLAAQTDRLSEVALRATWWPFTLTYSLSVNAARFAWRGARSLYLWIRYGDTRS